MRTSPWGLAFEYMSPGPQSVSLFEELGKQGLARGNASLGVTGSQPFLRSSEGISSHPNKSVALKLTRRGSEQPQSLDPSGQRALALKAFPSLTTPVSQSCVS